MNSYGECATGAHRGRFFKKKRNNAAEAQLKVSRAIDFDRTLTYLNNLSFMKLFNSRREHFSSPRFVYLQLIR